MTGAAPLLKKSDGAGVSLRRSNGMAAEAEVLAELSSARPELRRPLAATLSQPRSTVIPARPSPAMPQAILCDAQYCLRQH